MGDLCVRTEYACRVNDPIYFVKKRNSSKPPTPNSPHTQ